ncbi:zinc finger protein 345-like isoform X2 [Thunnus albacares]|uniref:zinc finger protein 345-like isoform X2 n=1 Tax=Thunnus albacares TaxID=8236 RepID=UPI001CF69AEA|nr:zinc finger protein 345-like isoform X2 [Thunnus albacares]
MRHDLCLLTAINLKKKKKKRQTKKKKKKKTTLTPQNKMYASFEERLCEEIRRYPHLYNSSLKEYKDSQLLLNSWREIAQTLGRDETACRQKWKYLRDRYVRAKRKLKGRNGRVAYPPPIITKLDWLADFIKHRATDPNFPGECEGSSEPMVLQLECIAAGPPAEQVPLCSARNLSLPVLGEPLLPSASQETAPSSLYLHLSSDSHLPLSSLRLLVPPLRLMSACMWQVALERNVEQYGKLAEFITLVTEMVPELMNYKQRTQLILGLRSRVILEFLKKVDPIDCDAIQEQLNIFQNGTTNCKVEEDEDGEVEISKSAFVELVQTLLRDKYEKDKFLKDVFPDLYGPRFDTVLQILLWEFLYRLEEFLSIPSFSKVSSMFDLSSFDFHFEQFVSDHEDLKKILQHQKQRQKLTKSEFSFMSDTILSTLASKQTSVASEDHIDSIISGKGGDSSDEETDDSSSEVNPYTRLQGCGLSPLTSSPCSEEGGAASDSETVGEASFQQPRSSKRSMKGAKEHLELSRNKEPAEESTIKSSTEGRSDVSPPFREDAIRANKNTCLECGKTFASRSKLKKHCSVHSSERPFKCTQCEKTYKSPKDLNQHFLIHSNSGGLSFACSLCEKKFRFHSSLTVHLRRHNGERPFPCSYCNKRFLTKSVLKSHMRIHTGERPYACTFCDKKFTQPYPRTVHLRMHMKEKPYLCSTCGMSFCSSGALLVHSRTHTGERPHQCESCGKSFVSAAQLIVHRRYHTGERPYPCSQCDKSFHCSSGLKKHMRTHTGEKPHQCSTCHKTFSQKSNMKIHLKVHRTV